MLTAFVFFLLLLSPSLLYPLLLITSITMIDSDIGLTACKSHYDRGGNQINNSLKSRQALYQSKRVEKTAAKYGNGEPIIFILFKHWPLLLEVIPSPHPIQVQARYCYRPRHNTAHIDLQVFNLLREHALLPMAPQVLRPDTDILIPSTADRKSVV